jgi:hypothetical protein
MELQYCIICGEQNVPPIADADIKVGVIYYYPQPCICENCYDEIDEETLNEIINEENGQLPF